MHKLLENGGNILNIECHVTSGKVNVLIHPRADHQSPEWGVEL